MVQVPEPFIRNDYPGLKTSEDDLLRKFLRETNPDIRGIETHVNLGPGEVLPEFSREELREGWRKASQLKADAIVETPQEFRIVELKDFIITSGLGQLLSYRYWFELERSPNKPITLWVTAPDLNPSAVQPYRAMTVSIVPLTQAGQRHLTAGRNARPPFGLSE